jgi:hypothetical protein
VSTVTDTIDPPAYERVARVQCMNPGCPDHAVVKEVPLPYLGNGVYLEPLTGANGGFLCGLCGNFGPMNRLFGNLREDAPEALYVKPTVE